MIGRLVERDGERVGTAHALRAIVTTIGRGDDNDIVLTSEYVSVRHAKVHRDEERYVIHDCRSLNGTLLNGHRLIEPRALCKGDLVHLPGEPGLTLAFETSPGTRSFSVPVALRVPGDTIRVDSRTAEVWVGGESVHVRPKEYLALALLFEKNGALVTKAELAARAWPEHHGAVTDDDIAQIISRLRRKLEQDPEHPRYLRTVRGLGYRLIQL